MFISDNVKTKIPLFNWSLLSVFQVGTVKRRQTILHALCANEVSLRSAPLPLHRFILLYFESKPNTAYPNFLYPFIPSSSTSSPMLHRESKPKGAHPNQFRVWLWKEMEIGDNDWSSSVWMIPVQRWFSTLMICRVLALNFARTVHPVCTPDAPDISNKVSLDGLLKQLRVLKSVMVDWWWGIVEGYGTHEYNWNGYKRLFQMVRDLKIKLHACFI
ncbi:hypothetical protein C1H46_011283 [Malus baccata]|uniref:Beta-amylase n=1 Tax=Malus baccata TaxID=106549 RepID=A0A540MWE3_MALBA|nr:hypothetical protein C1H46_011283 [Malus baccata]